MFVRIKKMPMKILAQNKKKLSVNFVPSTTDWAFAVNAPNTKANKIIDFFIIKCF